MSVQVRISTGVDYNVTEGPGALRGIVVRDSTNVDRTCQTGYIRDSTNVDKKFYNRQKIILPGTTFSKRGSNLNETVTSSSSFSIICRETPLSIGTSSSVYTQVDVTNFNTLCMDIVVQHAQENAQALVGLGNFNSYDITAYQNWPAISHGWAIGNGIRPGFLNVVTGAQTTTVQFRLNIASLSGLYYAGVCLVSRSSVSSTMHVSCGNIWME